MTTFWKVALVVVVFTILVASYYAARSGLEDRRTKQIVTEQLVLNGKIEAARRERVQQLNKINNEQCAALVNLYEVIHQTLVESDKSIDTIQYYRTHPGERRSAHEANKRIISRFHTPPCPDDIVIPNKPIIPRGEP